MKMRKLLSLCLAGCLLLSLAACGGGNEGTGDTGTNGADAANGSADAGDSGAAGNGDKIPLSMWFWGSDPGQQQTMQEVLIDPFNAAHPEYELTVEFRPSVNKDMAVALAAGEGPDIVYESSPALAMTYIEAGKYADLTPYAEQYGWQDKLIGPMYDSSTVNGKLYSVPMGLNVIGIVYNNAVLEENGWAVPTTLDELTAIMDEAMDKGMYAMATGNKGWKETNEDYSSLFLTNFAGTSEVYKCLTGEQDWNSEYIRYAVETSAEWYQKGYLCSEYVNLDWGEAANILVEGGTPFFFGPLKFIQNITGYLNDDNKDDFRFTVFPAGRDGVQPSYTIGATGILAINENTEHKDVCAEFLNMMFEEDFVVQMAEKWQGYWGVPLKTLDTIDTTQLDGLSRYFLEAIVEACAEIDKGNFGYYNSSYFPPETYDYFVNIDTVWFGEQTAEELLGSIDAVFPGELEAGLVPPLPVPDGV